MQLLIHAGIKVKSMLVKGGPGMYSIWTLVYVLIWIANMLVHGRLINPTVKALMSPNGVGIYGIVFDGVIHLFWNSENSDTYNEMVPL